MANLITVLICTHNRAALLARVLDSLNRAKRPPGGAEILAVANACTDDTHALLEAYARSPGDRLPLRWIAEPTPGKSRALNRAIPEIGTKLTAFVDDDHRVDGTLLRSDSAGLGRQRAGMGARRRSLPHLPAAGASLRPG